MAAQTTTIVTKASKYLNIAVPSTRAWETILILGAIQTNQAKTQIPKTMMKLDENNTLVDLKEVIPMQQTASQWMQHSSNIHTLKSQECVATVSH